MPRDVPAINRDTRRQRSRIPTQPGRPTTYKCPSGRVHAIVEDAAERDLEQPLIEAVKRRQSKRMALYQRPQLYKFAPGATREAAARYLEDLCNAGLEEWRRVTVIGSTECSHNIIQEARTLMRHIRHRDMWELRGPHTPTSDLEQPAYKSTDINTPEEDTTLDEQDTEIENWEAELAADPEEET